MMTEKELLEYIMPEPNTGCWIWMGSVTQTGYGQIKIKGKQFLAHRLVYETFTKNIIGSLQACHHCDNPICVNPDHIFLGTFMDNMADKVKKNRHSKLFGPDNGNTKLDATQIKAIKAACDFGFRQASIAKYFGISQVRVSQIHRNL